MSYLLRPLVDEGCDPAGAILVDERAELIRSYEALRNAVSG